MANVKISDLTAAGSASGTQEFEVNDSLTSRKVTGSQVATYVLSTMDAADVAGVGAVMDTDFSSNGLMSRTGAGTYAIVADNSSDWNTAFAWGNHASEGYLTGITGQSIKNLSDVFSSMTPTDGQVLTYDTTNGWQAETAAAGATGGGTDAIFWENDQTVTTNYTITDGKNAMSAGPITINSGVTVTVGAGEVWTVV